MKLFSCILIATAALNCWCVATPLADKQPALEIQLPFNDLLPPPLDAPLELELNPFLPPLLPADEESHSTAETPKAVERTTTTTTTTTTQRPTTAATTIRTTDLFKTTKQSYYQKQTQHIKELHLIDEDATVPHNYDEHIQHLQHLHDDATTATEAQGVHQQQQEQHQQATSQLQLQDGLVKQEPLGHQHHNNHQEQQQHQQALKSKHGQHALKKQQQQQIQQAVKLNINAKVDNKLQQKATSPQGGSHHNVGAYKQDKTKQQQQQQQQPKQQLQLQTQRPQPAHAHAHAQYRGQEISQETLQYYLNYFQHTTRRPKGPLPTLTPFPRHLK